MNNPTQDSIRLRLMNALPELERRILVREADQLTDRLAAMKGDLLRRISDCLVRSAEYRYTLYSGFQELTLSLPKMRVRAERNRRMAEFMDAFVPGDDPGADRKAFDRWMDITCVRERTRVVMHESDRLAEMLLHLLRMTLIERFAAMSAQEMLEEWEKLDLSRCLETELNDSPRWQNHVTVMKVWEGVCASLPQEKWRLLWSETWDRRMKDLLSTPEENPWLQVQVYKLCVAVDPEHALAMIHHRFSTPFPGRDDVFVRAALIDLLEATFDQNEKSRMIQDILLRPDPSEHVLIQAARQIGTVKAEQNLSLFKAVFSESVTPLKSDKVQASAAISLESALETAILSGQDSDALHSILDVYHNALDTVSGPLAQLALAEGLGKAGLAHAAVHPGDRVDAFDHAILSKLDMMITHERFPDKVRRIACEIREQIILNRDPDARWMYDTILERSRTCAPGESFQVPAEIVTDNVLLGRVLARLSVQNYGFYALPGRSSCRIWRGETFRRHGWRLLHELYHPDPAKRQGHVHTVGRCYPGLIRSHARYLAESTETKVPGERLFFRKEYSWRPFIPTVDDLLSTTRNRFAGRTILIVSSEGVFSLTGPENIWDRFMLWWYISLNYGRIAQKRHYDLEDVQAGNTRNFVQLLMEDFNFHVQFEPHGYFYDGKTIRAVDPQMSTHVYPLVRNQLEWRPLS